MFGEQKQYLWLKAKGRIIQLESAKGFPHVIELVCVSWKKATEDHWLCLLISCKIARFLLISPTHQVTYVATSHRRVSCVYADNYSSESPFASATSYNFWSCDSCTYSCSNLSYLADIALAAFLQYLQMQDTRLPTSNAENSVFIFTPLMCRRALEMRLIIRKKHKCPTLVCQLIHPRYMTARCKG